MLNNQFSDATNASIRELAEEQKQSDVEQAEKLRQYFSNQGIHVRVTGLEEFASKPVEEYEDSIREHLLELFPWCRLKED